MLEQDDLLAPISKDRPAGEDLSFSAEFDAIQEARRADDPTLDQGEWLTDLKHADWATAASLCDGLLRSRTKDLRVAAWLTEANARLHGFSGLAAGLRTFTGLCKRHWDHVHPQDHDAAHEERIGNLGWLLANAVQWLRAVPITQAPQGRFGLGDFEAAHARAGSNDPDADGQPALDVLEAARRDTPHGFYVQLMSELPDCRTALEELQAAMDTRLGAEGPSFTPVLDQLDHLQHTVSRSARDAGVLVDSSDGDATGPGDSATDATGAPTGASGPIASRHQALAQLREVADFFRRTEPHSPVAYLADKAARWGEMPLHVWLKRVIKDDATLSQVEELLDVDKGQESLTG